MKRQPLPAPHRTLVTGSRLFRETTAHLIAGSNANAVIVDTCDVTELAAAARHESPDVIVVELGAHDHGELAGLAAAAALPAPPRILLVCHPCPMDRLLASFQHGVDACISAEEGSAVLCGAFDAVCCGIRYVGANILDVMMHPTPPPAPPEAVADKHLVTPREAEVLVLLASGLRGPEIARELSLSPRTIHVHRTRLMRKLRVHNVAQLLRRALELGLVRPPR